MSIRILLKNLNGVFVSFSWISKIWFWISNEFFQLFVFSNCAKCYIHEWKENKQSCCEGVSISKLFKLCFSNCFCRKKKFKGKKNTPNFFSYAKCFIYTHRTAYYWIHIKYPNYKIQSICVMIAFVIRSGEKKWSVFIS